MLRSGPALMKWIYDLSYGELKNELTDLGLKAFAADQVFLWLYSKNVPQIDEWTNVSKTNRERLLQNLDTSPPIILKENRDNEGTTKFLFRLVDKHCVEAVLIPEKHHYTFCISTQVGCALNCAFCATGRLGFTRNLSSGEILSQVLLLKKSLGDYEGKINIVLMGMGEPLLNYKNLTKALEIITAEKGMLISPRNITLSTAGIIDGLKRLENDFPRIKISVSLNAPDFTLREALMPVSKKERTGDLLTYLRENKDLRKHRVTFEYVLLAGINDSLSDAAKVAKLLHGIPCKVNLIPYNRSEPLPYKAPSNEQVEAFSDFLHARGYTVIVRWSKGRGIKSACGQLAASDDILTTKNTKELEE